MRNNIITRCCRTRFLLLTSWLLRHLLGIASRLLLLLLFLSLFIRAFATRLFLLLFRAWPRFCSGITKHIAKQAPALTTDNCTINYIRYAAFSHLMKTPPSWFFSRCHWCLASLKEDLSLLVSPLLLLRPHKLQTGCWWVSLLSLWIPREPLYFLWPLHWCWTSCPGNTEH